MKGGGGGGGEGGEGEGEGGILIFLPCWSNSMAGNIELTLKLTN